MIALLALGYGHVDTAHAQTGLPLIVGSELTMNEATRAFAALQHFANCLVSRTPNSVAALLQVTYPSKKFEAETLRLIRDDPHECLDTFVLNVTTDFLRGALIEAVYSQHSEANGPLPALAQVGEGSVANSLAIASCVARNQPQLSDYYVRTKIGFLDARKGLKRLEPAIQRCAAQAQIDKVSMGLLRLEIAEALYRQKAGSAAMSTAK